MEHVKIEVRTGCEHWSVKNEVIVGFPPPPPNGFVLFFKSYIKNFWIRLPYTLYTLSKMMLLRAWITKKKKIGLNQGQFHTIQGNIQICIILYLYQTCIWDRLAPPSSTFLKLLLSHKSELCITFLLMTSVEFGIKKKLSDGGACIPYFEMDRSCDPVTS